MNNFIFGQTLNVVWRLLKPDGTAFNIEGYDYRLFFLTSRGSTEVQSSVITAQGNAITWTFAGDKQTFKGEYSLKLTLLNQTTQSPLCTIFYRGAFTLYSMAASGIGGLNTFAGTEVAAGQQVVSLYTVSEYVPGGGGGGTEQVQSDWTEADSTKKSFIRNKPGEATTDEIDALFVEQQQ